MNGHPSFADRVPRETASNPSVPADSFFEVTFADGSTRNEVDTAWSKMAEDRMVGYFGMKKQIRASRFPVKRIRVKHEALEATIEIPEGCEVYQAFRSELSIQPDGRTRGQILGRVVGIVRDGEVIEERFLSALGQEILGMRV